MENLSPPISGSLESLDDSREAEYTEIAHSKSRFNIDLKTPTQYALVSQTASSLKPPPLLTYKNTLYKKGIPTFMNTPPRMVFPLILQKDGILPKDPTQNHIIPSLLFDFPHSIVISSETLQDIIACRASPCWIPISVINVFDASLNLKKTAFVKRKLGSRVDYLKDTVSRHIKQSNDSQSWLNSWEFGDKSILIDTKIDSFSSKNFASSVGVETRSGNQLVDRLRFWMYLFLRPDCRIFIPNVSRDQVSLEKLGISDIIPNSKFIEEYCSGLYWVLDVISRLDIGEWGIEADSNGIKIFKEKQNGEFNIGMYEGVNLKRNKKRKKVEREADDFETLLADYSKQF